MKPFYKYAGHLLGALCLAATCFVSCSDEEWDGRPQVKEGVPVSVALPFETASASKVTTRLTDAQEFQMNDFYLLIFDAGGGVKFRQYYDSDALASLDHTNGNQANPTHGKLQLETTSGLSYIYGVANVAGSELNSNGRLKGDLDNLSSLDELKNLTATLTNAGNTQRSTAALLMSGTFHATGATPLQQVEGECVIPASGGTLGGTLYLRRLDSHITFRLALGSKIESFELKGWKVFNVPTKSYLMDRAGRSLSAGEEQGYQGTDADYADNAAASIVYEVREGKYCFDFYMQENLNRTSPPPTALPLAAMPTVRKNGRMPTAPTPAYMNTWSRTPLLWKSRRTWRLLPRTAWKRAWQM